MPCNELWPPKIILVHPKSKIIFGAFSNMFQYCEMYFLLLLLKFSLLLFFALFFVSEIYCFLTLFHVGGGEVSSPPHPFLLNNFFCRNRINLKLLDFLSYTYTHPKHLKDLKFFDYSFGFWATKATVKQFFKFFL